MLNSRADSQFNVKILSSNNHSCLQIKLPEGKLIFSSYIRFLRNSLLGAEQKKIYFLRVFFFFIC